MKDRLRRRTAALLLAFTAAVPASLAAAPPASAQAFGWVYISTPTWLGNCLYGDRGRVTKLHMGVGDTWSTPPEGDAGDDLVYAKVKLNANQQASYSAFCNKFPGWWQPGVGVTIKPTRSNQTVWIGPAGVRYN